MGKGNGEGEQERGERGWREEGRRGQAAGVREGVQGQLECGKPAWGGVLWEGNGCEGGPSLHPSGSSPRPGSQGLSIQHRPPSLS